MHYAKRGEGRGKVQSLKFILYIAIYKAFIRTFPFIQNVYMGT